MKQSATLTEILNDRPITREQDGLFLFRMQQSILLVLKEQGSLTETQFQSAHRKLQEEYRTELRTGAGLSASVC